MEIKKYFSKILLATVIAMATLLPCSLTFGMKDLEWENHFGMDISKDPEKDKELDEMLKAINNEKNNKPKKIFDEAKKENDNEEISIPDQDLDEMLEGLEKIPGNIEEGHYSADDGEEDSSSSKTRLGRRTKFVTLMIGGFLFGTMCHYLIKRYLKKKHAPQRRWWWLEPIKKFWKRP